MVQNQRRVFKLKQLNQLIFIVYVMGTHASRYTFGGQRTGLYSWLASSDSGYAEMETPSLSIMSNPASKDYRVQ